MDSIETKITGMIPSEHIFCLYVWPIVSHVYEVTIMLYLVPPTQFVWYILNYFKINTDPYIPNDLLGEWIKSVKEMSLDDNASWLTMF